MNIDLKPFIDWSLLAAEVGVPREYLVQNIRTKIFFLGPDEKSTPFKQPGFQFQAKGSADASIHQRELFMGRKDRRGSLCPLVLFDGFEYDQVVMPREELPVYVLTRSEDVQIAPKRLLHEAPDDIFHAVNDCLSGLTGLEHLKAVNQPYDLQQSIPRSLSDRQHPLYSKIPMSKYGEIQMSSPFWPNTQVPEFWLPADPWLRWLQVLRVDNNTRGLLVNEILFLYDAYKLVITPVNVSP